MSTDVKSPLERYMELPEGYPAELIEGEIVVSPSPDVRHQRIEIQIIQELLKHRDKGEVLAEIDIHFDDENVLRPDVIFIKRENSKIVGERWIEGPPDIVVEIVSAGSSGRDFVEKKLVYERFGVKEYWIVVPEEEKVYVFVHNGKTFELSCGGKRCSSSVLEGFEWGFSNNY